MYVQEERREVVGEKEIDLWEWALAEVTVCMSGEKYNYIYSGEKYVIFE